MAADRIFIDTNVLVFATVPSSPLHSKAIAALHGLAMDGAEGWISRQVVREYLVQITRSGVLPMPQSGSLAKNQAVGLMALYRVADETAFVTAELLKLIDGGLAYGKQVHDANIVATCLAFGIPRVLTHNSSDFQRYASLIAIQSI